MVLGLSYLFLGVDVVHWGVTGDVLTGILLLGILAQNGEVCEVEEHVLHAVACVLPTIIIKSVMSFTDQSTLMLLSLRAVAALAEN
jgi:hypothetical protein